jgi:hypothetical protein
MQKICSLEESIALIVQDDDSACDFRPIEESIDMAQAKLRSFN